MRVVLVTATAVASILAVWAPQALAIDIGHDYASSFAGSGTTALNTPRSVDVDNSNGPSAGDVYVTDSGAHRVEKFDANGNFILMFGDEVDATTSGDVCTLASGDTCQPGKAGTTAGQFNNPNFIAIDSTSGASRGAVYVADQTENTIQKFSEGGVLATTWGTVGKLDGSASGNGVFSQIAGIDVDNSGNLIVWDMGQGRLSRFNQAGTYQSSFTESCRGHSQVGAAVSPDGTKYYKANGSPSIERFEEDPSKCVQFTRFEGTTGINVDNVSGTLYQVAGTFIREYKLNSAGQPVSATGTTCPSAIAGNYECEATHEFGESHITNGAGIGVNSVSKTLYVADTGAKEVDVFIAAQAPIVITGEATGDKTISGEAKPDGAGNITECFFRYGTEAGVYPEKANCEPAPPYATDQAVEATIPTLVAETTYHYQLVAKGAGGGTNFGQDQTITPHNVKGLKTLPATEITPTAAELNGQFLGEGDNVKYFYEWGATAGYGNKTPEGEILAPSGTTAVPPATIEGLQPLHTYHYRVVATNSLGTSRGDDRTFTTYSAPITVAQSTSDVTGTSATLHAVIHPHGAATKYHFEYGPTVSYGSVAPIPDGEIPAGEAPVAVEVTLTNLSGGVYHFSVVAESKYGKTRSKDQTFNFYPPTCPNATVRQQTGANTLPDCRAYELVTPEDQGITIIYAANAPFSPTATSPSRLGFVGAFGLVPDSGEPANNNGDVYVATRTSSGWKTKYVGIPSSKAALAGGPPWIIPRYEPDKYQENTLWNEDLSAFVQWDNGIFHIGELYESLHEKRSNAPYVYDTGSGRQLDRWPSNVGTIAGGQYFEGRTNASSDLSHYVFTSDIPFAPGGIPGDMYDNNTTTGSVEIISYYPDNETHIPNTFPLAVSKNGSHILMIQRETEAGHQPPAKGDGILFMRTGGKTIEIAPGKSVRYVGETPDGHKVYFSTTEKLLPEDTDSSRDLYMWEEGSQNPNGLTEISKGNEVGVTGDSDECNVSWTNQCDIVPISFDEYTSAQGGSGGNIRAENFIAAGNGDIYYLSPEQLHGANGVAGQENLYVYRNGKNQFVAALDPKGIACTKDQGSNICSENAVARMEVSPDDTYMAFITGSNVTDYDSKGHSEMFLYRPAAEEIECVSCIPTGQPPKFDATGSHNGRYLTDDGRTFFETRDALVPPDTNEAVDVYEYVEGRPQLITSGTNVGNDSFGLATIMALPGLVGVSADGTDVYIATYDTLVGQDRNGEAVKIYDARSGGGFQFTPPVPPCVAADECHGPSTEAPATPASGTGSNLGDVGNLKPAKKGKTKKSAKKAKHKRKHHRKGKGAGNG
jgi:hypothetical protein